MAPSSISGKPFDFTLTQAATLRDRYTVLIAHFRGYRILKALLTHITAKEGLSEATDVILTGCSGITSCALLSIQQCLGILQKI